MTTAMPKPTPSDFKLMHYRVVKSLDFAALLPQFGGPPSGFRRDGVNAVSQADRETQGKLQPQFHSVLGNATRRIQSPRLRAPTLAHRSGRKRKYSAGKLPMN